MDKKIREKEKRETKRNPRRYNPIKIYIMPKVQYIDTT
jgi:hypothetical protein